MDTGSTVGTVPTPATEGGGALDAEDFEDFEDIYTVPFITVNRVDGRFLAQVVASDNDLVTLDRIQEAIEVGRRYGQHVYARKHGDIMYPTLAGTDFGVIDLIFTPDTDGGL
ncbi:MAG TPA: hypothetical protein VLJ40_11205 [Arthrobacter sp.]|nr:hypothetical protein [Arthrobacter sp.]